MPRWAPTRTPASQGDVLAWVKAHPPRGSTTSGTGSDSNGLTSLSFIYSRPYTSLDVTPEPGSDGRTLTRVLALVPWTPSRRSPDSLIKAGAAEVTVNTVDRLPGIDVNPANPQIPLPDDEYRTLSSTDPHVIQRITALVNALRPPTVDDLSYCDKPGDLVRVVIDFPGWTRVIADPTWCGDVSILSDRDGRISGADLGGGRELIKWVHALFGITWRRS